MTLNNLFLCGIIALISCIPFFVAIVKLDPSKKSTGPIMFILVILTMILSITLTIELVPNETPGIEKPIKWIYKQCDEATGECHPLQEERLSDIIVRGRK